MSAMSKLDSPQKESKPGIFFLDTNVFMYAKGAASPLQRPCLQILEHATAGVHTIKTSAEVIQEILHRYASIGRRNFGVELAERILEIFDPVLPVMHTDIRLASEFMSRYPAIRSRDAIHAAVAINNGISCIISTDRHFDLIKEIKRLSPAKFSKAGSQRES